MSVTPQESFFSVEVCLAALAFQIIKRSGGLLQFWLRAPSPVFFFSIYWVVSVFPYTCLYSLQGPVSKSSLAKEKLPYMETSALLLFPCLITVLPCLFCYPCINYLGLLQQNITDSEGLNNRNLFSQHSGSQNTEIKVPPWLVPSETEGESVPGLSPGFWWFDGSVWGSLACRSITLISAWMSHGFLPKWVCLRIFPFSPVILDWSPP